MSKPKVIFIRETPAVGIVPANIEFHVEGCADEDEILNLLAKAARGVAERRDNRQQNKPDNLITVPSEILEPLDFLLRKGR